MEIIYLFWTSYLGICSAGCLFIEVADSFRFPETALGE